MRGRSPGGPPRPTPPVRAGRPPTRGEWLRLLVCVGVLVAIMAYVLDRPHPGAETTADTPMPSVPAQPPVYGPPRPPRLADPPGDWRRRPGPPPPGLPFVERPELLVAVEDYTPTWEPQAYVHLLHWINSLDQAQIVARSRELGDVDPEDFKAYPERYRGGFFTVRGTIGAHYQQLVPRDEENPSGVSKVYKGLLLPSRGFASNFVVLEKEREYDLARETVELSGVFFKFHRFETETGEQRALPIFVGRRLEDYQEISFEESRPRELALLAVAVALAVILGLVIAFRVTQRTDQAQEWAYRERTRRRLQRSLGDRKGR